MAHGSEIIPPAANTLGMHNMQGVNNAHLKFYFETPLYYCAGPGIGFELYKPPFSSIHDRRLSRQGHPETLYVHEKDKLTGLRELQKGLNVQLETDLKSRNPAQVKDTLISLVDDAIMEPSARGIQGAAHTLEIVFGEYLNNSDIIDKLVHVASRDYTTATHSVNVMAIALRFSRFCGMDEAESKLLGLAALLHDVGKIKISKKILQAPRKLTDLEYNMIKRHTVYGYEILRGCNLDQDICLCALNHHERVDGSGYPNGITDIGDHARAIGFIDCYEALTCNVRPYRNAASPFDALSHIKKELFAGNFDSRLFESFVKSLG